MKNLHVQERPGATTSGLTSASQLVNMTDAVSFEPSNSCSAIPETIFAHKKLTQSSENSLTKNFRQVLRRSMRRKKEILDTLAKY